jgi:A/G-specific adenine glycosylase
MTKRELHEFQETVWRFFHHQGRVFPWRTDPTPYRVWVSELMLQQTQTERVVPKFEAFMVAFPTVEKLAAAPQAEVLKLWQGLGYNRRALFLHKAAQAVVTRCAGHMPETYEVLLSLPGIGEYTANAIQAFAFNRPSLVIETNIRAVYVHHFFPPESTDISDTELRPLIAATVDPTNPRQWYSALMDYGSWLKSQLPNPTRRSKHHQVQSKFEGSVRQLRGQILKILTLSDVTSPAYIVSQTQRDPEQVAKVLDALEKEGFLIKANADEYKMK